MNQLDFFYILSDLTLEEVFTAYYDCRRKKRKSRSAIRFELNYEHNLYTLWQDTLNHRYQTTGSSVFIVARPVKREVFAATFRDRIVHHLVMMRLNHIFETIFCDYSFSCRKGKGTLIAVRNMQEAVQSCINNNKECYVLRLDIQGYFFNINKEILRTKLHQVVNQHNSLTNKQNILYLLDVILEKNPIDGCLFHSPKKAWNDLPHSKSLFHSEKNCGLPIGNLTSQVFANLYLNDFDHYVCSLDKDLYYGRYVDDMVLIHPDREFLLHVRDLIRDYLKTKLGLTLHPKKISLQHYTKGFLFVGAYIKPGCIYPSKRFQKSFYRKINEINKRWQALKENELDKKLIDNTLSSINSYFGFLKYYNAWRVKLKAWNMLDERIRTCFVTDENLNKITLKPEIKKELILIYRRKLTPPMRRTKLQKRLKELDSGFSCEMGINHQINIKK